MADYTELTGRAVDRQADQTVYRTIGVATTASDANAPVRGTSTLSGTGFTIAPVCIDVKVDELRYPQRFTFYATWLSPRLRTE